MTIINLSYFNTEDFFTAGERLLKSLDIPVNPQARRELDYKKMLGKYYKTNEEIFEAIKEVFFFGDVDDQIFNNSQAKNNFTNSLELENKEILIFGIKLNWNSQRMPSRTNLLKIVRAFNRISLSRPVIILLQYDKYISLATNERTNYKINKVGEKIGRLFILKDINTLQNQTHSAHLRILNELSAWKSEQTEIALFTNYLQLFEHWQKVFDIEELNNRFYKEIANWYFWAVENVKFPTDIYENRKNPQQKANQVAVIRMLTRIIFVWFIKEKNLVDNRLFNEKYLKNEILNYIDKNNSTYYKAILQNLFFATLNTQMNSKQRTFSKQDNSTYFEPRYRYKKYFKNPEQTKNELFAKSPFLNGGLFESLDKKQLNQKEIRVDWFSDNKKNSLEVPDYLFFSKTTDQSQLLNNIYDTKKNTYFVKGLINILESYKFTIEENTPLEIEVALDPELLGKVFENLLAYHNPETGKTARKKTGSFYTPRQIVEYMTDESLKAYLQTNLKDFEKLTDLDNKLSQLISYQTEENPFSQNETIALIQAIDKMKILDPACGSGAFPMGMLQKLIWVLHKIDPDNKHWKKQQKERLIEPLQKDLKTAKKISFEEARKLAEENLKNQINEIEKDFEKPKDYARKLYLIQNSIFGIDIQTIAVQISKLRFFLSLIIEQPVKWDKKNYDLKPMPNLETKFVAANTLIGIEKPKQKTIQNPEIEKLEIELTEVRKKHFTAQNRKQKREIQKQDKDLRNKLSELLIKEGWHNNIAQQLANWNPYDQNISADFFDMQWMFGIKDKFDIVIGNPPYVRIYGDQLNKEFITYLKDNFESAYKKFDLYVIFMEKGLNFLNKNGLITYIVPDKWITQPYGEKIRNFILNNTKIKILLDLTKEKIFQNATVDNFIFLIQKNKENKENIIYKIDNINNLNILKIKQKDLELNKPYLLNLSKNDIKIIDKINEKSIFLNDICYINWGCRPTPQDEFISNSKINDLYKPLIVGKNISKYYISKNFRWVKYVKEMYNPLFKEFFENTTIIFKDIIGKGNLQAGLNTKKYYCDFTTINVLKWKKYNNADIKHRKTISDSEKYDYYSMKFLLTIVNSNIVSYYFNKTMRNGLHTLPNNVKKLPIPLIDKTTQQPFITIVDYILHLKEQEEDLQSHYFEQIINGMVYELYFESELKTANKDIIQFLQTLPSITSEMPLHQKTAIINNVFNKLHDAQHPVKKRIEKMNSIPEIQIIEGKE